MEKIITSTFSSPVRLKLLYCLSRGRKNVQELINNCGLSQSAVSQHLKKMRVSGFVKDEKEGKFVFYSLKYQKVGKIAEQILEFAKEVKS